MTEVQPAPSELGAWPVVGGPRVVFEHAFYPTVVEEDLELPNGSVVQWLRYADDRDGTPHPDGVMGICVNADGGVLLARQYNPGAARVVWEFPGGGTHGGESYEDALRRELMEEVGWYPGTVRYLGRFLFNNRRSGWGIRTFLATDLEPRRLPSDDGEVIECTFVTEAAVDRMIAAGELDNGTVLAGWALYRAARLP